MQAGDGLTTAKAAVQIVQLCHTTHDLKALNAHLLILSKRRGQLKNVLADIITEAMKYIDELPAVDDKVELISTLRTISEGKVRHAHARARARVEIDSWCVAPHQLRPGHHLRCAMQMHVEVERARLTRMLAEIREREGKIDEASEILQEVQIETVGSMEALEKARFLLEQVRFTFAQRDFVKMGILSNKLSKPVLSDPKAADIRRDYYRLRIEQYQHAHDAVAICKEYQALYKTPEVVADEAQKLRVLQNMIVYLALAPWDNWVSDTLHRILEDKATEDVPSFRALCTMLTTNEIISWPLPAPHHDTILAHEAFQLPPSLRATERRDTMGRSGTGGAAGGMEVDSDSLAAAEALVDPARRCVASCSLVCKEDEDRVGWAEVFHKRIVQHNVRVVAKWHSRIRSTRLASLLGVDDATMEAIVSEMASDKSVYAKIDRPAGMAVVARTPAACVHKLACTPTPFALMRKRACVHVCVRAYVRAYVRAGIVVFAPPRAAASMLSDWGSDISSVLDLLERTNHLIQKEIMVKGAGGAVRA
ncbi:hypothetical protein EON67_04565 [archaeon]|nr:MAG: hypothetical protein EON67_04565 [archaeon]